METDIRSRVIDLVAKVAGVPPSRLQPAMELEEDLGITGDDAQELIYDYAAYFQMDMTAFKFHRHFEGESLFAGFLTKFRGGESMQHAPVTIDFLVRAAQDRRWPQFPARAT
jgi:hypothetical protein